MMNDGHLQQRGGVHRQALGEAHQAVGRAAGADDDHEAEHEQRVGEDRADDRRLRDHQLALFEREDHDEQLGQVAERRLHHAGDARPEALAELLGGERHDPRQPRERERGEREAGHGRPRAVVGDAGERREHRDQQQEQALEGVMPAMAPATISAWPIAQPSDSPSGRPARCPASRSASSLVADSLRARMRLATFLPPGSETPRAGEVRGGARRRCACSRTRSRS